MSKSQTLEKEPNQTLLSEGSTIQLIVPVYNEGENVVTLYKQLQSDDVRFDEIKFIYDFDEDRTLPFISILRKNDPRVVAEKNTLGRGVVFALQFAFSRVRSGPVIVLMGDNSDKLSIIPCLIQEWERGASVVCPSRYMSGGEQHGGGLIKPILSRLGCRSLGLFGFPTSDATNNFKLYDGDWLRRQRIESRGGFEIALELCVKAVEDEKKVVEIPTIWRDRTAGESKFKLLKWLPHYLRWYFRALTVLVMRPIRRLMGFRATAN